MAIIGTQCSVAPMLFSPALLPSFVDKNPISFAGAWSLSPKTGNQSRHISIPTCTLLNSKITLFTQKYSNSSEAIDKKELLEISDLYLRLLDDPISISAAQLTKIYFSLFLKSELEHLQAPLFEHLDAPDPLCLLFELRRFLTTDSIDSGFYRLVKRCEAFVSIIKLAHIGELNCYQQRIQKCLEEQILIPSVSNLKTGECVAIPTGWITLPDNGLQGHFILLVIQKNADGDYRYFIINTHSLQYADSCIRQGSLKQDQLPLFIQHAMTPLFEKSLRQQIQGYKQGSNSDVHKELYLQLEAHILGTGTVPIDTHASIPSQVGAKNCIFMSFYVLLRFLSSSDDTEEQADGLRQRFQSIVEGLLEPQLPGVLN